MSLFKSQNLFRADIEGVEVPDSSYDTSAVEIAAKPRVAGRAHDSFGDYDLDIEGDREIMLEQAPPEPEPRRSSYFSLFLVGAGLIVLYKLIGSGSGSNMVVAPSGIAMDGTMLQSLIGQV